MERKKFAKNQSYRSTCWFTGGVQSFLVVDRDDTSVLFNVSHMESDGLYQTEERFDVRKDSDGNEYVVLYVYEGHENVICAA